MTGTPYFPHERILGDEVQGYIHPDDDVRMRDPGIDGQPRDWILEIHFIDRPRQVGGFFEQVLMVD